MEPWESEFPHANGCEPAVIKFTKSIDETFGDEWHAITNLDQIRAMWAEQGQQLESALRATVSGALYDALYAVMTARQASLLVITHEKARAPAFAAG